MTHDLELEIVEQSLPVAYPPKQSEFTRTFWDGLGQGVFRTTCCEACGKFSFPPKPFCPHCWGRKVRWEALPPMGTLYSGTTIYAAPQVFRAEAPYPVGIVDLDAGVRIATRLLGSTPITQMIGRRARLVSVKFNDAYLYAARVLED